MGNRHIPELAEYRPPEYSLVSSLRQIQDDYEFYDVPQHYVAAEPSKSNVVVSELEEQYLLDQHGNQVNQ